MGSPWGASGLAAGRTIDPFSRSGSLHSKIFSLAAVWFSLLLATTGCTPQPRSAPALPPLLDAARTGNMKALRDRLDAGAAISERDERGRTALHWGAIGGGAEAAALLLDRGADVDARAQFAMTPLHWAAVAGKAEVADLLARRGADVRARNDYGMTPLHEAATAEVARVLLARGAPAGDRDHRGMTPLHLARTGKVAKALLEAGADPFARAADGRRPMEMSTGADWERDGLIIYAARASARLRGEQGTLAIEIRNIFERQTGPLGFSAESPGCDVDVAPASLARLDPGELAPIVLRLARRPGSAEGEYPLALTLSLGGRPAARLEMRVNTVRAETPQDRGMMRLGKATIRRASSSSRLQYLAFAAVPVLLAGLWLLWRRRR